MMNPECTARGPGYPGLSPGPYGFLTPSLICVPARIAMAGYLVPFHGTRVGPKAPSPRGLHIESTGAAQAQPAGEHLRRSDPHDGSRASRRDDLRYRWKDGPEPGR